MAKVFSLLISFLIFFHNGRIVYAQVQTGIGTLPVIPTDFANKILEIGMGLAGGTAFFFMAYGGFLFLTSGGDPHKIQEATEIIMSAIAGLLLIVFSVFLLNLIGVQILGI
ncbi:hypothetical protein HY345_00635 [Candidatus Microgenomates bacterium]|nr:hypothetical protein [Candidatus Microgenomates bacterium]